MLPLAPPRSRLLPPWAIHQLPRRSPLGNTLLRHRTTPRHHLTERIRQRVRRSRQQVLPSPLPLQRSRQQVQRSRLQARHSRLLLRRSRPLRLPFRLHRLHSRLPVQLTAPLPRLIVQRARLIRLPVHRKLRTQVPTPRQVQRIRLRVPSIRQPLRAMEARVPTGNLDRRARGGLALEATLPVIPGGSGSSFWTGVLVALFLEAWRTCSFLLVENAFAGRNSARKNRLTEIEKKQK